ncbi:DNA-directed RNA polymerase subunit alpha, partial [Bacillus mycoides]
MIEIEKPKIETVELNEDAKYGKFVIEPLERGYGTGIVPLAPAVGVAQLAPHAAFTSLTPIAL